MSTPTGPPGCNSVRLDRWLWAARFFKTRAQAKTAIDAGHVQLNGNRAKSAKDVGPGDELDIHRGWTTRTVIVTAIAQQLTKRGPRRRIPAIARRRRTQVSLRAGGSTAPTFEGAERESRGNVLRVERECPRQCPACRAEALLRDQRLGEQQVVVRLG